MIPRGRDLTRRRPRKKNEFWTGVLRRGPEQCWPWMRGRIGDGYGIAPWKGKQTVAHKVAWMLTNGDVPDGYQVDHRCHDESCTLGDKCPHRQCCNPRHLQLVTQAQNKAAGRMHRPATRKLRATHCPQGHEYTPENTRVASHGGRNCRECERGRSR